MTNTRLLTDLEPRVWALEGKPTRDANMTKTRLLSELEPRVKKLEDNAGSSTDPVVSQYVVVAGGGGGGAGGGTRGGGGGAGGMLAGYLIIQKDSGKVYTFTIGAAGTSNGGSQTAPAFNGSDSSLISSDENFTAKGGGGGGSRSNGNTGGSGGGAGQIEWPGGGTPGQGNSGGGGNGNDADRAGWGGGGGAGAAGGAGNVGGSGKLNPVVGSTAGQLIGTEYWLAGGGGVGEPAANLNGGAGKGNYGANTGGGGNGGDAFWGGSGYSGVGILAMPTSTYSGKITGSPTVVVSGSKTILQFKQSGTYTA